MREPAPSRIRRSGWPQLSRRRTVNSPTRPSRSRAARSSGAGEVAAQARQLRALQDEVADQALPAVEGPQGQLRLAAWRVLPPGHRTVALQAWLRRALGRGATRSLLSRLEADAYTRIPRRDTPVVVYDDGEGLAATAAQRLTRLGYSRVSSKLYRPDWDLLQPCRG